MMVVFYFQTIDTRRLLSEADDAIYFLKNNWPIVISIYAVVKKLTSVLCMST